MTGGVLEMTEGEGLAMTKTMARGNVPLVIMDRRTLFK